MLYSIDATLHHEELALAAGRVFFAPVLHARSCSINLVIVAKLEIGFIRTFCMLLLPHVRQMRLRPAFGKLGRIRSELCRTWCVFDQPRAMLAELGATRPYSGKTSQKSPNIT